MKRTLKVVLSNAATPVGTLFVDVQRGRQSTAFEYDRTWLNRPDGFALDSSLPRVPGPQFKNALAEAQPFMGPLLR